MPVNEADVDGPVEFTVNVPVCVPSAVGVNVTPIEQLAPPGTCVQFADATA
jgi:hypothetical protein